MFQSSSWRNQKICPECAIILQEKTIGSLVYDVCSHCEWVYFDIAEMKWAIDSIPSSLSHFSHITRGDDTPDHPHKAYSCPNCKELMTEKEYLYDSGIHIDFCNGCYWVFLNKWELMAIQNYMESTETSPEWIKQQQLAEKIGKKVDIESHGEIQKIRGDIEGMFFSDDLPGMWRVMKFVLDRFAGL